jgi:hypothetical protein
MDPQIRNSVARRLASVVPLLILLIVAANQIRLARDAAISPWKGGGFGMFASTDGGINRHIRAYVETEERYEEVRIPRSAADLYVRAKTLPTDRQFERLAEAIFVASVLEEEPTAYIHIELWRVTFEREQLRPAKEKLVERSFKFHWTD